MTTFRIAGLAHHQHHLVDEFIEQGDTLELRPEPSNKFDPNAIEVFWLRSEALGAKLLNEMAAPPEANHPVDQDDLDSVCPPECKLGYVPRQVAAELRLQSPVRARLEDPYIMIVEMEEPQ